MAKNNVFSLNVIVYPSNKHIEFEVDSNISEKSAKLQRVETIIELEIKRILLYNAVMSFGLKCIQVCFRLKLVWNLVFRVGCLIQILSTQYRITKLHIRLTKLKRD